MVWGFTRRCTSDLKDGKVLFGNLYDGRNLYPLHHHDVVQAMSFSPSQYWLYIALDTFFVIWDLVVFNLWLEDVLANAKGDLL